MENEYLYMDEHSMTIGPDRVTQAQRDFSKVGFGLLAYLLLSVVGSIVLVLVSGDGFGQTEWGYYICYVFPQYAFGFPVAAGVLWCKKREPYVAQRWSLKRLGAVYLIMSALSYELAIVGNILHYGLFYLTGQEETSTVIDQLDSSSNLLALFVFTVILAPVFEELLLRRLVLERILPYGEKQAILLSAGLFALLHGNFQQMFYAFALGCVFGYVYCRTRRISYTIGLHMLFNFFGGVFQKLLVQMFGETAGEGLLTGMILLEFFAGMALLIYFVHKKQIYFQWTSCQLSWREMRRALWAPGLLGAVLLLVRMTLSTYFSWERFREMAATLLRFLLGA